MKPRIAVAISGGIDSLVAAWILKQRQFEVLGFHFITGFESPTAAFPPPDTPQRPCHLIDDSAVPQTPLFRRASENMTFIARQLQIPIKLIDCRRIFRQKVVDYFTHAYLQGFTPNPCLVCNPTVKFGYLLQEAQKVAANSLATGHYALISRDDKGRYHLIRGADPLKEQSYFLAFLTQRQLAAAYFPLGGLKKSEVQAFAKSQGLQALSEGESQDICFINEGHYADFIQHQTGIKPQAGLIETTEGRVIGEHQGVHRFTIGQRRGLNCPAAEPYYVLRIDIRRNKLIVGFKKDTYTAECCIRQINWIHHLPRRSLDIHVRIRYGQKAVPATLVPLSDDRALIRFKTPQSSITPGQGAVCYQHNEVIGAGWIDIEPLADTP